MRRGACLSLAVVAALLVGCGETEKDRYVGDYRPLDGRLRMLGKDLGVAVNGASGERSGARLAARFIRLDRRFGALRRDIAALDTPDDLKDESRALTGALRSTQQDVAAIGKAAKDKDPGEARTAAKKLVRDAERVNTSQERLARATGAKVEKR